MFNFVTLDPRPIPAAQAANEAIFATGLVYGIEVTVPALAKRCVGNLDPQHAGGNADQAAIEAALTCEVPPYAATLATVRADLDAVGAMAVLAYRLGHHPAAPGWLASAPVHGACPVCAGQLSEGEKACRSCDWTPESHFFQAPAWEGFRHRLELVAAADKFSRGGYPGPRPLPSKDNPWPEESASAESLRPLAAIAAAVMDFKVPIEDRVATMLGWLVTGEEPASYRQQVEKERQDMIASLETGAIKAHTTEDDKIAVVVSTHRSATMVGYMLAPVVVALNPQFRVQGGDPHVKFTVCQFTAGYVDLPAVLAELQGLEPGWGGTPNIIGSPQGVGSKLTTEQVTEVVAKHLK